MWWESGVSHTSVLKHREDEGLRFPADLYLEGSDQHRGWFQSSLLTSMGAYGVPPYKSVMHCGFTMDAEGKKMSKSAGNGVDPADVMAKSGADVLRLWVASVDYSQDVNIGDEHPRAHERGVPPHSATRSASCWEASTTSPTSAPSWSWDGLGARRPAGPWCAYAHLLRDVERAYDEYQFHLVYRAVYDYIVNDLSAVYMDATKDRLYSEAPDSPRRRARADRAHEHPRGARARSGPGAVVHRPTRYGNTTPRPSARATGDRVERAAGRLARARTDFAPALPDAAEGERIAEDFGVVLGVREAVTKALEDARARKAVNKSQEADRDRARAALGARRAASVSTPSVFEELFIVAGVTFEEADGLAVEVVPAEGEKCPRCWNYRELGVNPNHPHVCARCGDVLDEIGYVEPDGQA